MFKRSLQTRLALGAICVLSGNFTIVSPAGAQRIIEQKVAGAHRLCTFQRTVGGKAVVLEIPRGEPCPPFASDVQVNTSDAPPPSARLTRTEIKNGTRICTFSQSRSSWSVDISLTDYCPLTAGMLQKQ